MSQALMEVSAAHGDLVARHAAGAAKRRLPAPVADRMKLHIIDTLAAIVSGSALEAGRAAQRYAAALGGNEIASILGTRMRLPLIEAALVNGMAAHADESDDSHEESQTHPGCGVVPSALVVGEMLEASGADFLNAVELGYDMTVRFGLAFGSGMTFKASSMSSHAYGPLFGAGYAAGALMRFDATQFRILLNYLAQEASGLTTWRLDRHHTLKSYVFAGMPASNGVKAAALVKAGFTGDGDVLDMGGRNMLDAICPQPRVEALTVRLDRHEAVLQSDIKCYPVGYPIASPLAALERIIAMRRFDWRDVRELRIRYDEDWYKVVGDESRMPSVNLRYCMAVTLIDRRLTFAVAHDENRMASREVLEMGARIRLLPPEAPMDRFTARVELDIGDEVLVAEQDRYVLGRAQNPMSADQVHEKAIDLMGPVIGSRKSLEAIALVQRLEQLTSVRPLIESLCR
jgi:2-methylcitrate dehydratase PrpD